jgi:hypothetical protein
MYPIVTGYPNIRCGHVITVGSNRDEIIRIHEKEAITGGGWNNVIVKINGETTKIIHVRAPYHADVPFEIAIFHKGAIVGTNPSRSARQDAKLGPIIMPENDKYKPTAPHLQSGLLVQWFDADLLQHVTSKIKSLTLDMNQKVCCQMELSAHKHPLTQIIGLIGFNVRYDEKNPDAWDFVPWHEAMVHICKNPQQITSDIQTSFRKFRHAMSKHPRYGGLVIKPAGM